MKVKRPLLLFSLSVVSVLSLNSHNILAQQVPQPLGFEEYDPVSTLKVEEHKVRRAKFPFIDVHNHQYQMPTQDLKFLVGQMDSLNMGIMINLSGRGWSQEWDEGTATLKGSIENIAKNEPKRIALFTNLQFKGFGEKDWTERAVKQLEADFKMGAKGLKIYKNLGFSSIKDDKGNRVAVNDPRLNPVWKKCGELKIPVLIHTADVPSFWDPMDRYNERWLELKTHPNRRRGVNDPVPFDSLIAEQHYIFKNNPKTIFINAHMGWYPNNLKKLDSLMTALPNMYVEIAPLSQNLDASQELLKSFLTNGRTEFFSEKIAGYLRNTALISVYLKQKTNIFHTTKSTTLSGACTVWDFRTKF